MRTGIFHRAHHPDDGGLTPSQLSLLRVAQIRNVSALAGTRAYFDIMMLYADGYLCTLDGSTAAPVATSIDVQFTVTAAGLAWLRDHGHDEDWQCRCRVCAGEV